MSAYSPKEQLLIKSAEAGVSDKEYVTIEILKEIADALKMLVDKEQPETPPVAFPDVQKVAIEGAGLFKGDQGEKGDTGLQGEVGMPGERGVKGDKGERGEQGEQGEQGTGGENGRNGEDGKDGSPDTATEIRNKLEMLSGDDRLDKSFIKGLDEIEKNITRIGSRVQTPAKAYAIHTKDCTSQCDGSRTTFSVGGSHFGIVGVFSTEFPQVHRPVIDYTETATGFTLTSQITPPATGQTLIAQFLK